MDPDKYSKFKKQAGTGLENKFELMSATNVNNDLKQLNCVYQTSMKMDQFRSELHNFDLTDVFLIPNTMDYRMKQIEYWETG